MGLKRMHTPCFAPDAKAPELSPIQVRRFLLAARKTPDSDNRIDREGSRSTPGEKLDKPAAPGHISRPNATH